MTDRQIKYLTDILSASNLIDDFLERTDDFDQYIADFKTQSAVERQLGIIGEAVNKYEKSEPRVSLQNASQIISFRNRLIHAYDAVDSAIVWAILKRYLPPVKIEIQKLIS